MRETLGLNGVWSFHIDQYDEGEKQIWHISGIPVKKQVEVPHIWQREEEYIHYCGAAWYEKSFTVDNIVSDQRLYLCFAAVDFQARIWLNGIFVGEHEGGFTPFEFDITDYALAEESNLLSVRVYDPQDNAEIPIGKQGSWYTRVSGIWQQVYVERRSIRHIKQVHIIPHIDEDIAEVRLQLNDEAQAQFAQLAIEYTVSEHMDAEQVQSTFAGRMSTAEACHLIPMNGAKLWSPDQPYLYDLTVKLISEDGRKMDEYQASFGMRKIEYREGRLLLNHQPLFIRGSLDQAFYPKTIYTAPSDQWIQDEIRQAKDMGFNLLRKHIKIELPRYLYWADRMGMLIWEEPPNAIKWSEQSRRRFYNELSGMVNRDYNHPSIIIWSLYNEEWGLEWDLANDKEKQDYVRRMYNHIKEKDPSRLICDNSGWIHVQTDINDYHRYFIMPEQIEEWNADLDQFIAGRPEQNYVPGSDTQGKPVLVSEFGAWGLPSVDKLRDYYEKDPWWFANLGDDTHQEDFKVPLTAFQNFTKYQLDRIFGGIEDLAYYSRRRMLRSVKSQIEEMRKRPTINGYVATQFTDVEWETNGWLDCTREMKTGFENAKDFNGSFVIMADRMQRNMWCGDIQAWDLVISNHNLHSIQGELEWAIVGTDVSGRLSFKEPVEAFVRRKAAIRFTAPTVPKSSFYTLKLSFRSNGEIIATNEVELTISPKAEESGIIVLPYRMSGDFQSCLMANGMAIADGFHDAQAVITTVLDDDVLRYYYDGGHVLFLAEEGDKLSDKGQFTFRELDSGESWDRASSLHYVDAAYFDNVPLRHEMGWEMEGLYPEYIIPFSNYRKLGGTMGRVVHMFGNENIADTSLIVSGYFQGWIGQAGGSVLVQTNQQGSLTIITWKLKDHYGIHPIATQVVNAMLMKTAKSVDLKGHSKNEMD